MPSQASLDAGEYYAFGRNAFWTIVEAHLGVSRQLAYEQRKAVLLTHGIAVWDVLKTCRRSSSLDSDIQSDSVIANDFQALFQAYPAIERVYFNGAYAEKLFLQHVKPGLSPDLQRIVYTRLPSTSPANARLNSAAKAQEWSLVFHSA